MKPRIVSDHDAGFLFCRVYIITEQSSADTAMFVGYGWTPSVHNADSNSPCSVA
jgi:hypothetical protein